MYALLLAFSLILVQGDDITVSADLLERTGDTITYTGDVILIYQDVEVRAASVSVNQVTEDLVANQGVSFIRGNERLSGSELRMNLKTLVGVLFDAEGYLGEGFLVKASEVRRDADGLYELFDATITTCDEAGHKGWEFSTKRARIDPSQNIRIANSLFKIKNVPIFYLPFLTIPVETKSRSTGFLLPQTSTSTTKGRSFRQSFYYVISRSADLMLTGEYFTERGMSGAVDFRAVPNSNTSLEVDTFFAGDRQGEGGLSATILGSTEFGDRFRAVADMDLVSSFSFRQVFEEGFDLISSPTENSRAFATYNTDPATYNFLYSRRGTFFVNQPTTILRKFPSLDISLHARRIGSLPLYFSLDGSFSGMHRRDGVVDTPAFVERIDVHPSIEIPIVRRSAFSWSHRIGFRSTFYSHSQKPIVERKSLNRIAFDYSFEMLGPQLEREFGNWKHVIEPRVEYRYVTGVDRFLDTILVDDTDLYTDTNEVRYGITNRFFRGKEILSWTLSQKYFSDPTFGGAFIPGRKNVLSHLLDVTGFGFADEPRRFSPLVSVLRFSPKSGRTTDLQIDYDTVRKHFRSAGIIGGHQVGPSFLNIAYFFTRRSPIQLPSNQIRATVGYGDSTRRGLNGAFSFAYNVDRAFFQATTAQVSYNTDCYGLHVEFNQFDLGPRRESRIRFSFSLKNLGSIGNLRSQDRLF